MTRALAKKINFATEAELCAAFIDSVKSEWTAYAETAGWDILLVRKDDGFQIGIEAKLRLNAHVLSQAVEQYSSYSVDHAGPDCRAVLVPEGGDANVGLMAPYIGITIIRAYGGGHRATFYPQLPTEKTSSINSDWHEWLPARRHELPEYVPDVAAGAPAPLQLTKWKIAAIKIAVTLEQRGYVTRGDFKKHGIDHRRWLAPNSWLRPDGGRYVAGRMPDFKAQHPTVYEQIAADAPKWMPEAEKTLGL